MFSALKLPEESLETNVDGVFTLVALDETVNVTFPDSFAENVAEPERPVPDVPRVKIPSLTGSPSMKIVAIPLDEVTVEIPDPVKLISVTPDPAITDPSLLIPIP